MLTKYKKLIY